jgi:Flp pilus assembly protein TadD
MWMNPLRAATITAASLSALLLAATSVLAQTQTNSTTPQAVAGQVTGSRGETPAAKAAAAAPRRSTAAERAAAERLDPVSRAAFWAGEANMDESDSFAGVKLAASLRQLGRFDEADAAAVKVLVVDPKNVEAMLELARARIGTNQGFYAIQALKLAESLAPKDWRPVSLMGVALEQSERLEDARVAYQKALVLSPENPAVLSNLAMSYALHGDPRQAEALLRRAVAQPAASMTERQNLALVVGLQGRIAEAEKLIREDLPPDVANANLAYLQAALSAPAAAVPSPRLASQRP